MYEFDRFRLDPENHLLRREGQPISLSPKAFEILLVLVENGGGLTTKEELMRRVWPDSFVEDANLTVTISMLRKQLGLAPNGQQFIETVPTKGYRFAIPVKRPKLTDALPSENEEHHGEVRPHPDSIDQTTVPADNDDIVPEPRHQRKLRSGWWVLAGILLSALIAGISYVSHHTNVNRAQLHQAPRRLAILPFQNLQENSSTEFLGFSLADAVITKLGNVSELSVRPSYAIQKYRGRTIDIAKAAADLNVDTLLTGTFIREGDDLRIAYQLIDVKTQNILWKGAYDLKYDKLLTVQAKVSEQIIRGLELNLTASESDRLRTSETVTPLAYEYYLRGVDLYSKSDFPTAIKMLERSTELAPGFALSWANLGRSYTASASFHFGGDQQYQKAQAAFEKAIALQPDGIDARIYMANMFTDTGRVELAVPLLREALKRNPNHAEVHWELGYAYRFAGMLKESVSECELARLLDPGVKLGSSALNAYLYLGQYDRFLASLPQVEDSALVVFYRGLAEYYKGDLSAAGETFDRAFELDRSVLQAQIGRAFSLAIRHQQPQAESTLRALESKINQRGVMDPEATYKIAQAYASSGDRASAMRVLSQSIDHGFFPYPYFLNDPLLSSLRGEPGFSKLMTAASNRHEQFRKAFFQPPDSLH